MFVFVDVKIEPTDRRRIIFAVGGKRVCITDDDATTSFSILFVSYTLYTYIMQTKLN